MAFDPTDLDITLWLDGSDANTITLDGNGRVSSWADKSGNGNDFVMATEAYRPDYIAGKGPSFDNRTDFCYLQGPSNAVRSVVWVYKYHDGTGDYRHIADSWHANSASSGLLFSSNYTPTAIKNGSAYKDGSSIAPLSLPRSQTKNITICHPTSAVEMRNTGGGQGIGSRQFYGIHYEIITSTNVWTTEERQLLEGYLAHKHGLAGSLPADHPYKDHGPTSMVRNSLNQPYDLLAMLVRQSCDQIYSLNHDLRNQLIQSWSARMLAVCNQHWGDMPRRRSRLNQVWGSTRKLRNRIEQEYGDMPQLLASFDQVFHLQAGMRARLEQQWSVAEGPVRALFEQVFAIEDKSKQRAILDQLWVLAAGEAIVYHSDITITAELDGEIRELTSMTNINDELDSGQAWNNGELQLADQAEYLFCKHKRTSITNSIDDEPITYLAWEPTVARNETGPVYVVPLSSKVILLEHQESEYSSIDEQELSGMRKDIVEMLAAPVTSVDWQLKNTFLPAGVVQVNGRTRLAIIKEIVDSLGGIVRSAPDGTMICRKDYPRSVNTYKAATPDIQLTDQDDLFRIQPRHDSRPGYNIYHLTNRQPSADDLRKEEITVSHREKLVRVTPVPWVDTPIRLDHSGGSWVQVINDGVRSETREDQIEIILGAGRLPKSCQDIEDVDYMETFLGDLQADEAGAVSTEIADNSQVVVRYVTKYHQFRVINDKVEDVQVWPMVA